MGRIAALALMVALATPTTAWDKEGFKRDVAWLTASATADFASTHRALASGGYEANPLLKSDWEARKALLTGFVMWMQYELRRRGHNRTATVIRWALVALWSSAAAWNLHQ